MVGCSRNRSKQAHKVPKFLQDFGYTIIPINRYADQILGKKVYPDLRAVGENCEHEIDVINVFRPSQEVTPIAEQVESTEADIFWMQLGIRNAEAARIVSRNNLTVVQNRCMKSEYLRLFGLDNIK